MPIVNAWGVVLSRRDLGEADRLSTVYTETHGKVPVRFVGVNKPGRKMKALSEPLVWAEYRLYLSARSEYGKCVGGQLISTFPEAREDFDKSLASLAILELLDKLTPDGEPSAEKYRLLCSGLALVCQGGSPWVPLAFGFQLLTLAGHGLRDTGIAGAVAPAIWTALHDAELGSLADFSYDAALASRLTDALQNHVEATTGRALKTREFVRQLHLSRSAGTPEAVH